MVEQRNDLVASTPAEPTSLINAGQSPEGWAAGVGIAEAARDIWSGNWVEKGLGALDATMEAASIAVDPLGTLISYNLSWLMEHVEPLREALDFAGGDPEAIQAYGQTFTNIGKHLEAQLDEYRRIVDQDFAQWSGEAAKIARDLSKQDAENLQNLATEANVIGSGYGILSGVISFVRSMVREIVSMFVGRIIAYAIEAALTAGMAAPLIAAQVSTLVANCVSKIAALFQKVIKSLGNLGELLTELGNRVFHGVQRINAPVLVAEKYGNWAAENIWRKLDQSRLGVRFGTDIVGRHKAFEAAGSFRALVPDGAVTAEGTQSGGEAASMSTADVPATPARQVSTEESAAAGESASAATETAEQPAKAAEAGEQASQQQAAGAQEETGSEPAQETPGSPQHESSQSVSGAPREATGQTADSAASGQHQQDQIANTSGEAGTPSGQGGQAPHEGGGLDRSGEPGQGTSDTSSDSAGAQTDRSVSPNAGSGAPVTSAETRAALAEVPAHVQRAFAAEIHPETAHAHRGLAFETGGPIRSQEPGAPAPIGRQAGEGIGKTREPRNVGSATSKPATDTESGRTPLSHGERARELASWKEEGKTPTQRASEWPEYEKSLGKKLSEDETDEVFSLNRVRDDWNTPGSRELERILAKNPELSLGDEFRGQQQRKILNEYGNQLAAKQPTPFEYARERFLALQESNADIRDIHLEYHREIAHIKAISDFRNRNATPDGIDGDSLSGEKLLEVFDPKKIAEGAERGKSPYEVATDELTRTVTKPFLEQQYGHGQVDGPVMRPEYERTSVELKNGALTDKLGPTLWYNKTANGNSVSFVDNPAATPIDTPGVRTVDAFFSRATKTDDAGKRFEEIGIRIDNGSQGAIHLGVDEFVELTKRVPELNDAHKPFQFNLCGVERDSAPDFARFSQELANRTGVPVTRSSTLVWHGRDYTVAADESFTAGSRLYSHVSGQGAVSGEVPIARVTNPNAAGQWIIHYPESPVRPQGAVGRGEFPNAVIHPDNRPPTARLQEFYTTSSGESLPERNLRPLHTVAQGDPVVHRGSSGPKGSGRWDQPGSSAGSHPPQPTYPAHRLPEPTSPRGWEGRVEGWDPSVPKRGPIRRIADWFLGVQEPKPHAYISAETSTKLRQYDEDGNLVNDDRTFVKRTRAGVSFVPDHPDIPHGAAETFDNRVSQIPDGFVVEAKRVGPNQFLCGNTELSAADLASAAPTGKTVYALHCGREEAATIARLNQSHVWRPAEGVAAVDKFGNVISVKNDFDWHGQGVSYPELKSHLSVWEKIDSGGNVVRRTEGAIPPGSPAYRFALHRTGEFFPRGMQFDGAPQGRSGSFRPPETHAWLRQFTEVRHDPRVGYYPQEWVRSDLDGKSYICYPGTDNQWKRAINDYGAPLVRFTEWGVEAPHISAAPAQQWDGIFRRQQYGNSMNGGQASAVNPTAASQPPRPSQPHMQGGWGPAHQQLQSGPQTHFGPNQLADFKDTGGIPDTYLREQFTPAAGGLGKVGDPELNSWQRAQIWQVMHGHDLLAPRLDYVLRHANGHPVAFAIDHRPGSNFGYPAPVGHYDRNGEWVPHGEVSNGKLHPTGSNMGQVPDIPSDAKRFSHPEKLNIDSEGFPEWWPKNNLGQRVNVVLDPFGVPQPELRVNTSDGPVLAYMGADGTPKPCGLFSAENKWMPNGVWTKDGFQAGPSAPPPDPTIDANLNRPAREAREAQEAEEARLNAEKARLEAEARAAEKAAQPKEEASSAQETVEPARQEVEAKSGRSQPQHPWEQSAAPGPPNAQHVVAGFEPHSGSARSDSGSDSSRGEPENAADSADAAASARTPDSSDRDNRETGEREDAGSRPAQSLAGDLSGELELPKRELGERGGSSAESMATPEAHSEAGDGSGSTLSPQERYRQQLAALDGGNTDGPAIQKSPVESLRLETGSGERLSAPKSDVAPAERPKFSDPDEMVDRFEQAFSEGSLTLESLVDANRSWLDNLKSKNKPLEDLSNEDLLALDFLHQQKQSGKDIFAMLKGQPGVKSAIMRIAGNLQGTEYGKLLAQSKAARQAESSAVENSLEGSSSEQASGGNAFDHLLNPGNS